MCRLVRVFFVVRSWRAEWIGGYPLVGGLVAFDHFVREVVRVRHVGRNELGELVGACGGYGGSVGHEIYEL